MLEWLLSVDHEVFLFFHGIRNSFFDTFFYMFSGRFIWIPMYAGILFCLYRSFNWRQATVFVLGVALTITLADQLGASVFRPIFGRLRPAHPESPVAEFIQLVNGYMPGGSHGFPSCHAANTMALAMLISLYLKRWSVTIFLFAWAFVTCYSRIYLAAHYPGDLIAGTVLGMLVAVSVYFLCSALSRAWIGNRYRSKELKVTPALWTSSMGYYSSNAIIILGSLTILYICVICL